MSCPPYAAEDGEIVNKDFWMKAMFTLDLIGKIIRAITLAIIIGVVFVILLQIVYYFMYPCNVEMKEETSREAYFSVSDETIESVRYFKRKATFGEYLDAIFRKMDTKNNPTLRQGEMLISPGGMCQMMLLPNKRLIFRRACMGVDYFVRKFYSYIMMDDNKVEFCIQNLNVGHDVELPLTMKIEKNGNVDVYDASGDGVNILGILLWSSNTMRTIKSKPIHDVPLLWDYENIYYESRNQGEKGDCADYRLELGDDCKLNVADMCGNNDDAQYTFYTFIFRMCFFF
jgi:hypothetical protein